MTVRQKHTKVIHKLLYRRCFAGDPVSPETVADWFPVGEAEQVKREIERMASDPGAPVRVVDEGPDVCLSSVEEALTYLDKHDSYVPSGLEAFLPTTPVNESRL